MIDADAGEEQRRNAAARLRLDPRRPVRVLAAPLTSPLPVPPDAATPSATVATPYGLAHVTIGRGDAAIPAPVGAGGHARVRRLGIGLPVPAHRLPESWSSSLVALRLSTAEQPVVDAAGLGALLAVAELADAGSVPGADADALEAVIERGWPPTALRGLAEGASLRAVAARLGLHHSTVQARVPELRALLGYDPFTGAGRVRLAFAVMLHHLAKARFDE